MIVVADKNCVFVLDPNDPKHPRIAIEECEGTQDNEENRSINDKSSTEKRYRVHIRHELIEGHILARRSMGAVQVRRVHSE